MQEIYLNHWGKANFENDGHLSNFIKYLFSKSKAHKVNRSTMYNYYKRNVNGKFKVGFMEDNEAMYEKFLNSLENDNYSNYYNDLTYVYFAIHIDNVLVCNFLNIDEENQQVSLNLDKDSAEMLIKNHFQGFEETLIDKIKEILAYADKNELTFIDYLDIVKNTKEDNTVTIKIIETLTHRKLQEEYFAPNTIFQIAHNDQFDRPYHIHRLIIK